MRNYFNYFTEVEERFQERRGSLLMLSTLDWALIEAWKDAGVPLAAVLRGIDEAFDRYEARKTKGRARRVNGLAWCAQAVMEAAEQMREASLGAMPAGAQADTGFEGERIARHMLDCSAALSSAQGLPTAAQELAAETAARLSALAGELRGAAALDTEALEATLRALESKLLAMLTATVPEAELAAMRMEATRELAPYRSRMGALQIRQIEGQFLEKRLLEKYTLPRLSLFYMRSGG